MKKDEIIYCKIIKKIDKNEKDVFEMQYNLQNKSKKLFAE